MAMRYAWLGVYNLLDFFSVPNVEVELDTYM